MGRLQNAPSDLPGGRPVASAAVSGLTPSPAALRASHPAPAERTAAWPPPATALRRPIALTPFWAATFTRARVLAKLAGRSGPGYRPPGTKARAAGLTSPWTATPPARGPLTRPPTCLAHIRSSPFLRLQCAAKQLPLCSSGGAGHASTSGLIHPGVEANPSPPAPVVDRFGCVSPGASPHRRPPTGTASSRPRANSRSYRACPCTWLRLQSAHV